MKRLLLLACLLAASGALAQVKGETGGVYIAGENFDFEQAAADVFRARASGPYTGPLSMVALGRDLHRMTTRGASPEVRGLVHKLAAANTTIHVCERDLRANRLVPGDLIEGVRLAKGWTRAEAQADVGDREAAKDGTPEGQLRRIRRICAEA